MVMFAYKLFGESSGRSKDGLNGTVEAQNWEIKLESND